MTSPLWVFISAFGVSSFAGLASLLRSGLPLTRKSVASHMLNSGVLGLGISLLWYSKMRDNVHFLVGLCVLAGLGGMASVDMFVEFAKRFFGAMLAPSNKKSKNDP